MQMATLRKLYLFTSEYPYGKQETFLENEISVLSKVFEITLIPRKIEDHYIRELPSGVKIDLQLARLYSKKRYHKAFAFLNLYFWYTLIKHFKFVTSLEAIKRISAFTAEYVQVQSYLRLQKYDKEVILYSYWFNGVAYAISKSKETYNISRAHRYDVYEDVYNPSFMPFRQEAINGLKRIFFISGSGLEHVARRYTGSEKFHLSKLGTYSLGAVPLHAFQAGNSINIVTISNVYPVKRVDLIARRIVDFSTHYIGNISWDHFGDGPDVEKVYKALEKSPANLEYKIHGRVTNKQLHEMLKKSNYDVLINLSSNEGLPVSMMEALSYGIPILATNVGGVNEIVNVNTGILIKKEFSTEEFEKALLSIKNKIISGFFTKKNIHEQWSDKFSADKNYGLFMKQLLTF